MRVKNSGQILLLTLLVLSVIMILGLSFIGRVRVETTISTDVEESMRAFNAAEAGIEDALQSLQSRTSPVQLSNNLSSYTTNISSITSAAGFYEFPQIVERGSSETLWLVNHNLDQTLNETPVYTSDRIRICWRGTSSTNSLPALLIQILYKRANKYHVVMTGFDPNTARGNNFSYAGEIGNGCGQTSVYSRDIIFSSFSPPILTSPPNSDILIALRVIPLYSDARVFFDTQGALLASQGNVISSTGKSANNTQRKIVVFQYFRSPPSIFDAAVISQSSFSK